MKVEASEVERRIKKFKASAREAGVKLTHQRLEILREVASSLEHPTAEEVLRAVQPRMPTVSLDTVYRTLSLLTDLGLVTTLGPRRESTRFDANPHHHHHYICMRCGLARDFDSDEIKTLRVPPAVKELGSIVTTHVEVRGVCRSCAKEKAKESATNSREKPQGKRRRT